MVEEQLMHVCHKGHYHRASELRVEFLPDPFFHRMKDLSIRTFAPFPYFLSIAPGVNFLISELGLLNLSSILGFKGELWGRKPEIHSISAWGITCPYTPSSVPHPWVKSEVVQEYGKFVPKHLLEFISSFS